MSKGGIMEKRYCTIFIVDISQNPEDVDTVTSRIIQLIEDHGGVIVSHNPWGKRRLAYQIDKKNTGFYVEIEFTAQSRLNIPQILENEYRINDRVMRFLTYVVTKDELLQRKLNERRAKTGETATGYEGPADKKISKAEKVAPDVPKELIEEIEEVDEEEDEE
jgi:small subunit ribosomal protein S6